MGTDKEPILEYSFRTFRKRLLEKGIVIPTKKEILGMSCDGHYHSIGGFTKIFNQRTFALDDTFANFLVSV